MEVTKTASNYTADELATIAEYWPEHGSTWPGWREVMPQRSYTSIDTEARRMGLRRPRGSKAHPLVTTPYTCPFCDGHPVVVERHDGPNGARRWYVTCNDARCYANAYVIADTRERAIAHWNKRGGR